MSHLDEGTLHSYLDGELSPEERAAVESHLSQCATCRASLAEERALLDRASTLLGSARPVERPAPSFEQLRRESKRSPWRVRRSIAWAASIVLAVGLGYSLRGAAPEASDRFALYDRREPAATIQNRPATDQGQFQARSARRPAVASAPPATPATPAADEVARQREKDTPAAKVASRAEPITREEAPSAHAVAPASLVDARADTVARKQVDNYQRDAVVVTGRAAANAGRTAAAPQVRSTLTEWPIITRAAARALLGTDPMGLPGLATRRIRRSPGTDRTVIVEQAVDSATVIQIFQRPATLNYSDDSSARGYAFGDAERGRAVRLARFVGRLRVEINGPLSPDSLNRLLEQVAPLP